MKIGYEWNWHCFLFGWEYGECLERYALCFGFFSVWIDLPRK